MPITDLFTTFIYQPFFNIFLLMYWILDVITQGHPDMGIAVILLTLIIRLLLLPISLSGDKSEPERREITEKINQLKEEYSDDRITFKKERKKIFQESNHIVVGEIVSLVIQVTIALMLWRMFETGLTGKDLHLTYPFMPDIAQPFNLQFLGRYDLTHSSLTLNVIQSIMIFIFETVRIMTSPYPSTKKEIVRLQLTLPIVSFLLFLRLPAGKKLFVITTLVVSTLLVIVKYTARKFRIYRQKMEEKQVAQAEGQPESEAVLVETK